MNPRFLIALLLITSATSASAFSIIGATDSDPNSYDMIVLEEILLVAHAILGDTVSREIITYSQLTSESLEENIIVMVTDGRVIINRPEGIDESIDEAISELESIISPYLPYTVMDSVELSGSTITEQFGDRCFSTTSDVYELGTTTGIMPGQMVSAEYEDYCIGTMLVHYGCSADIVVRSETICSEGCLDGACLRPEPEERRRSGSGIECDTRWLWTREGFVCERIDVPAEDVEIEPPVACAGCVSGERCLIIGDRLPNNRTCTGAGILCLECALAELCIPEGSSAPDGRICSGGSLVAPEEPAPEPDEPPQELPVEPVPEPAMPEPVEERRGLWNYITDFFRNLFRRS